MTYKTKYHGATDYKGARISVTDWNGNRTYHSYRYDIGGPFNPAPVHRAAVEERAKLDNIHRPCAAFVYIGEGFVWSTRNEATE
jgi:hypothetical protein